MKDVTPFGNKNGRRRQLVYLAAQSGLCGDSLLRPSVERSSTSHLLV